jgi:type II secretory pathway pseudopilin PulG
MSSGEGGSHGDRRDAEAGLSLVELLITMGVLGALMAVVFQSMGQLVQSTTRDSTQSYVTSRARAAVENVTRSLRDEFVMFNTVPGTPLGVNFSLNDTDGTPLVWDGILYYFDSERKAQIYSGPNGQPFTAGLTDRLGPDTNGDGKPDPDTKADVIGIGLVRQHLLGWDKPQDFIDLNHDANADVLDGDGNAQPLWTLSMVRFNNIGDVNNVALWKAGQVLATNVYIQRVVKTAALSGSNIIEFQFSAHNPTAMLFDTAGLNGNANDTVEENELGNMTSVDGLINAVNEVAAIDSITITLNVVELSREGLGRTIVLSGDISSDIVTPRTLALIRRNGIVGLPNPALSFNIISIPSH